MPAVGSLGEVFPDDRDTPVGLLHVPSEGVSWAEAVDTCMHLGRRSLRYRCSSLIRKGRDKNKVFWNGFWFLHCRKCNRSFFVNVLNFKKVPPTVFPAFLKFQKNGSRSLTSLQNEADALLGRKQCQYSP